MQIAVAYEQHFSPKAYPTSKVIPKRFVGFNSEFSFERNDKTKSSVFASPYPWIEPNSWTIPAFDQHIPAFETDTIQKSPD